jgi:hypothetical protein
VIMKKSINSFFLLTKCQDVDAHTLILDLLPSFDIMGLTLKSLDQHSSHGLPSRHQDSLVL